MRQPEVGSIWGKQRLKMLTPLENIHFSHVDVCPIPIVEEAIYRSIEVAEQIMQELGQPFVSSRLPSH